MKKRENKPIVETLINTAALALTSFGILQITQSVSIWEGYGALMVGMFLEFFKYYGRQKGLW